MKITPVAMVEVTTGMKKASRYTDIPRMRRFSAPAESRERISVIGTNRAV